MYGCRGCAACVNLKQAALRETGDLGAADDQVVERADVHQCQRLLQRGGQKFVGTAWLRDAGPRAGLGAGGTGTDCDYSLPPFVASNLVPSANSTTSGASSN